ncbi:MAG: hypothetical protein ACLGPM_06740 [Acidobacteriota bacterium]
MRRSLLPLLLLMLCLDVSGAWADGPAFDLTGPKVDVHVKRGTITLPISEVPNLLPGDRLWVHPDLPENQSEHFVLVVAFLRGSTNPPPADWFTRVETWTRAAHDEGVFVNVPQGAQQALLFLAPETSGDFKTLRKAVRSEPGSFVRAAQDLQAASWERLRLEAYLADVKITSKTDLKSLKVRTEMAARSLGIKINESCFDKPPDEQAACLSHNSEGMVLDDSNAQSLVSQLANGSALDLVNQLSWSTMAGGGMYSPYVGAVVDTIKILGSLHTAHFQYIPALALPTTDTLNLRLNIPPSFRNPKSVVVIALPPIGPTHAEALYPVNSGASYCAPRPGLVLPAEGAPLVYATPLAHNLVLRIKPDSTAAISSPGLSSALPAGPVIEVPVRADPTQGGLVFSQSLPSLPSGPLTGQLQGKWGFDDWTGPTFHLYAPRAGKWAVAADDQSALVVGRPDALHLVGEDSECVERVAMHASGDTPDDLTWSKLHSDEIEVKLPLKNAQPGPVSVDVYQYGLSKPDQLRMTAYAVAASLQSLTLSAGDADATLKGTRLDQVAHARLHGIVFTPAGLSRAENLDELALKAGGSTAGLAPGRPYTAQVDLKDGRRFDAPVTVLPPRPKIMLLSKGVQAPEGAALPPLQFGSPDDLPVDGRLVFFLKSNVPASFPRDEKIELAAADSSFHTMLGLTDGSLLLADTTTAEAALQPRTRFGFSAFGPVRVRAVSPEGLTSDWVPLGTLVRVPGFKELRCPRAESKPCILTGTNLFLTTAVSATQQFADATQVPPEFTGTELVVPHPVDGQLYVKLRDDPSIVQTLTLPVTLITVHQAKKLPEPPPTTPVPATTPSAAAAPPTSGKSSAAPGAGAPGAANPSAPAGSTLPSTAPTTAAPPASGEAKPDASAQAKSSTAASTAGKGNLAQPQMPAAQNPFDPYQLQ